MHMWMSVNAGLQAHVRACVLLTLYVYASVYVYGTCMHVCMLTCLCVCREVHVCLDRENLANMHVSLCAPFTTCLRPHAPMYLHIDFYIHACVHAFLCQYMYTYMACIYIPGMHTCIHEYSFNMHASCVGMVWFLCVYIYWHRNACTHAWM